MQTYYDEENHKYYVDGEEKPSVTEIAKPISFERLNNLPKHILEKARKRGDAVHEIAEEYLLVGELDFDDIEQDYIPYIEQFIEWVFTYKPKVLYTEYKMFSLEFAGTCDLICELDGKTIIVDYKTTSAIDRKSLSVQLEGYSRLCKLYGIKIDECWYLHLKKDTYIFKPLQTDSEWFEILLKHSQKMREEINGRK